ncbi:MAG: glycosyltransferase family A protein [Planctomycetota bacterium]|jgi:hypothetical protein|nr:glycosyltransferase family A protein [Planctomycetota bacterium]MDP6989654.1 glycosyltransferase family A protein [Planctomycetota bacterium]
MSRFTDALQGTFLRLAAGGLLPATWFGGRDAATVARACREGKLTLEIVSHCWRYAHLLSYQLSSLVQHRTDLLEVTMTVFHAEEDERVVEVLDFFGSLDVEGVRWNWKALERERLMRRSIGRNIAAKQTRADWVWFTDCDIVFHEGCLETLARELQGRDDPLVFPRRERITELLEECDERLARARSAPEIRGIPLDEFSPLAGTRDRAKGAYQITHGDVARAVGYCDSIGLYQRPADRWRKTYEDRAFRWLLGTQGTGLDIPGVCQIRHMVKGRYQGSSLIARLRANIRKAQAP